MNKKSKTRNHDQIAFLVQELAKKLKVSEYKILKRFDIPSDIEQIASKDISGVIGILKANLK